MGNKQASGGRGGRASIISNPVPSPMLPQSTWTPSVTTAPIRRFPPREKRRRCLHLHMRAKGYKDRPIEGHGYGVILSDDERSIRPPPPFSNGQREVHIQLTFFEFLSVPDLCRLQEVSCYFYCEAGQDKLWIKLLKRDFPFLIPLRYGKNKANIVALSSSSSPVPAKRSLDVPITHPSASAPSSPATSGDKEEKKEAASSSSSSSGGETGIASVKLVTSSPPSTHRAHNKDKHSHADLLLAMVGDHGAPMLRRSSSALAGPVFELGVTPIPRPSSASINKPGFSPVLETRSIAGLVSHSSSHNHSHIDAIGNSSGGELPSARKSISKVPQLTLPLPSSSTSSSSSSSSAAASGALPSGAMSHRGSMMPGSSTMVPPPSRMRARSHSSTNAELHAVTVHDPLLIWKEEQAEMHRHSNIWEDWDSGRKPAKFCYEDEVRRHYDPCLLSPVALASYLKSHPDLIRGITDMCKAPAPGTPMELATRGLRQTWPDVDSSVRENYDYLRCFYFAWHGRQYLNRRVLLCHLDQLHGLQSYSLTLDENGNPIFVFSMFSHSDPRQFFRHLLQHEALRDLMGGPSFFRLASIVDASNYAIKK